MPDMSDAPDDIITKDYEIGFIAREKKGAENVLSILKTNGAEILLEGPVERIPLAYAIKKELFAEFGFIHFRVVPASIRPIREALTLDPLVLRSLIITPPFQKARPRFESRKPALTARPPEPETRREHEVAPLPLSNEALEKKIEEILQ